MSDSTRSHTARQASRARRQQRQIKHAHPRPLALIAREIGATLGGAR